MGVRSGLSSPGDITAEPILSSSEIDGIISKLLIEAIKSGGTDKTLLAQLSIRFNTALIQKSYSEKELISNVDEVFNAFIDFSLRRFEKLVENGTQEEARQFVEFINFLLKLLKIKKVYNNIPRQDFCRFSENEDHTQILQLTLPRGEDLGERPLTHGGSCHNWSIIFKQYFDKLGIPSSIIFCTPFSNHSFTLIELKGRYYVFDPILREGKEYLFEITENIRGGNSDIYGETVSSKNRLMVGMNQYGIIKRITKEKGVLGLEVEVDEKKGQESFGRLSQLTSYPEITSFTNDLDSREIEYIIVGYRLEDGRGFKLDFNREGDIGPGEHDINVTFNIYLGNDSHESELEVSDSISQKKLLTRFLSSFFGRSFDVGSVNSVLCEYKKFIEGKDNTLYESQSKLLNFEEINRLSDWIAESTNYQMFEAFFSLFQSNIGASLFSSKNKELLEHFKKSTSLMHKRSVVKFLLLGVLVPFLDDIEHKKGTYSRNKLHIGDDSVGGDVETILALSD